MRRFSFFLVLLFALTTCLVQAQVPDLQLPFMSGDTWWCSQGWNGTTSHTGEAAWDYNFGVGASDLGYPLLAAASGRVVFSGRSKHVVDEINSLYRNDLFIDEFQVVL